jgi:transcription termination factor NusA
MGTPMTAVTGIGPAAASVLADHGFDSAEELANCSIAALVKVPGFGAIRAATIKKAAQSALEPPVSTDGKKDKKAKAKKKKTSGKGKKAAKSKKAGSKKPKKAKKAKKAKGGKAKGKKAKNRKKR